MRALALLAAALAAGGLAAATGTTVTARDFEFAPLLPAASAGSTITFVNGGAFAHSMTSGVVLADGRFDTGLVAPGGSVAFEAPGEAGRYAFFCARHAQMVGVLAVR